MQGMPRHPWLSQDGCCMLGWTNSHVIALILISPCSLGNWIDFSLTWHDGGGLRLPFSSRTQPSLGGNGLLLKRSVRS
jgi:hypothetical protein